MTVQEALDLHLKPLKERAFAHTTATALDMAIESMEKQVAKKPIETEHFNCLNYECPICGGGLYHEQQYCDECGQALKWGEEDD